MYMCANAHSVACNISCWRRIACTHCSSTVTDRSVQWGSPLLLAPHPALPACTTHTLHRALLFACAPRFFTSSPALQRTHARVCGLLFCFPARVASAHAAGHGSTHQPQHQQHKHHGCRIEVGPEQVDQLLAGLLLLLVGVTLAGRGPAVVSAVACWGAACVHLCVLRNDSDLCAFCVLCGGDTTQCQEVWAACFISELVG